MNRISIKIALFSLLFLFSSLTYSKALSGKLPTEEQVGNLAAAAWKERSNSIDITLYLELTTPPKPIEQIRQEVEELVDEMNRDYYKKKGWEKDSLPDYAAERRKRTFEMNFNSRVERQKFPRLIKKRIRISGNNQRVDQVIANLGEKFDPNVPFDGTYVNVGDKNSKDFFSFHYENKIKRAIIDESGWVRRDPSKFEGLPSGTMSALQAFLGTNQGTLEEPIFVPDSDKIEKLSRTGLATIDYGGGIKINEVYRILISPAPNSPDTREQIEIGDPNYLPTVVMLCDKEDYSRVYDLKFCNPLTGHPFYIRECSNFDSQGFPHNVTEIQYDVDGNLKEKSVYNIVSVDLNPSFPDDLFTFNPPEGYKVVDNRTKKP